MIASSGFENPCVQVLRDMGAKWTELSVDETIGRLIHTQKLVFARGTFSRAAAFLSVSRDVATFYMFDEKVTGFEGNPAPDRYWDCETSRRYRILVLRRWTAKPS
jgi:hypothetical protein